MLMFSSEEYAGVPKQRLFNQRGDLGLGLQNTTAAPAASAEGCSRHACPAPRHPAVHLLPCAQQK